MEEWVPSKFYLSQNYPNPFKGKTTIKYCVPDKTLIKITILDHAMKIIRVLVNGVQEAGTHEVVFNSGKLNYGIYHYKLEAKGFNKTKEMILTE